MGGLFLGDVPPNLLSFDKNSVSRDVLGLDSDSDVAAPCLTDSSTGVSNFDLKDLMYGVILFFLVCSSANSNDFGRVCGDLDES